MSNSVVAKFKCNSVENFYESKKARLTAIYSDKGENADFTKFTPSGNLDILIINDALASNFFEPGECYYLTFTKALKE